MKWIDRARFYIALCKLRVIMLMIWTAWVGMFLAPVPWSWMVWFWTTLGITLGAASAAVINHVIDASWDAKMIRTHRRPIPAQHIQPQQALIFAAVLACLSMGILICRINLMTAGLTALSLIGYAFVYTIYLKHATPHNIAIGGLSGASPPLLGWTACTASIDAMPLTLVLIIFLWTPPHFWSLSIYRLSDYQKASIPMLPVTHGIPVTCVGILTYTYLLAFGSLLPLAMGQMHTFYAWSAGCLNIYFLQMAHALKKNPTPEDALSLFKYSIYYLMLIFLSMILDYACA